MSVDDEKERFNKADYSIHGTEIYETDEGENVPCVVVRDRRTGDRDHGTLYHVNPKNGWCFELKSDDEGPSRFVKEALRPEGRK